jgi:single-strand DNA-binding protein
MNVWIGEGRLVRDPELKVVGGGTEICNITVAIDRGRKDKDGNKQTDFVDCTAFGKTGAFIDKYFKRGDGILVRGRFQSDKYTAKDGTNRVKWGVWIDEVDFPIGKGKADNGNSEQPVADATAFPDVSQDDIPF